MLESVRATAAALLLGVALLPVSASASESDLSLYAELLASYAHEAADLAGTRIDYASLRSDPKWEHLVSKLRTSQPKRLQTRHEKLAFWINAYNILAIQTVLDGYPLESIRDLGSFFSPVWKREAGAIGGKPVTLHEIEHQILRPMNDPRIHAAIVCASTSCPSLRPTPFTAADIDAQLDQAMAVFLADTRKGLRIDRTAKQLTLSSIFDWFEEDFASDGGIPRALFSLAPEQDRAWLRQHAEALSIEHFDYDWRLNDTTPADRRH